MAVGVPYLGAELLSAITAEYLARKRTLTSCTLVCLFAPTEFTLYYLSFGWGDNRGMAVFHIVLRNFTFVDLHRFCKVVGGETLLKPSIAFVLFVRKNTLHGAD